MTYHPVASGIECYLGIECGGTRSTALMRFSDSRDALSWSGGPANLRLLSDAQLLRRLQGVRAAFPRPTSIAIGLAGARTSSDRARVSGIAQRVWPGVPCLVCNDLETAIAAAPRARTPGPGPRRPLTRVLVLSGTGSCCLGRTPEGRTVKIGGWGHILGDKGSAYEIGLRALKAVVYYLDREERWSSLGRGILRRLMLNEPDDLIDWAKDAAKDQVAELALEVFEASESGDQIARDILKGAAATLAHDAVCCAKWLARPGEPVQFVYSGSVMLRQRAFAAQVTRIIRKSWNPALITPLKQPSVMGAAWLAMELASSSRRAQPVARAKAARRPGKAGPGNLDAGSSVAFVPVSRALSPTERRNPRSMRLNVLPLREAIRVFLKEDAGIPARILKKAPEIEKAVRLIVRSFKAGGRLFYIGAGTSGRLGVLDASECPPTFRTPPGQVQGIMAGGQRALWESIEGAEDDAQAGANAVEFRGLTSRDVLVGIAASGRTPYVWGGLGVARRVGASTVLLCCNPHLQFPRRMRPEVVIDLDLGPELLTGSTRLKSGTATKLVLNLLSTLSMVRMGKVVSNLMIDLKPSNTKLRHRAVEIVRELTGVDAPAAQAALEKTGWRVKEAWSVLARTLGGPQRD